MRSADTNLIVLRAAKALPYQGKETEGPVLYFNGSYPLFSAEIKHYASQDGWDQLRFIDVSAMDADLGSGLVRGAAMRRFHVRLLHRTLLSSARAFMAVWASLPGWLWAAQLANVPGVITILELAYRAFLRVRPLLAKMAGYFGAQAARGSSSKK